MKILYIVQHFCGLSGSGSIRPYEFSRRLVDMGHEVTVLCGMLDISKPQDIEDARAAGITIHQAPIVYGQRQSYLSRILTFRRYMRWAIRQGKILPKPDVVFASSTPLTIGDVGRRVAAHHRVPFVFEVRDLWPEIPIAIGALKNPLLRWIANRMAQRVYYAAHHIVALSPGMKDGVIAWGVPAERISVIPNSSDTHIFGNRDGRMIERRRLNAEGKLLCLHTGAMGVVNCLDYLLDCAKELDKRGVTDIQLLLIGDGTQKVHLAERVRTEGIRSAVVRDSVSKRQMVDLLAAGDVGLVNFAPVLYMDTNSANKFFDYLAAGLPVIINYGGWQGAVLQETGAGISVNPRDPNSLADALLALRDDPALCARMGKAARKLAEERYDRGVLAQQLEHALVQVVRGKGTSIRDGVAPE